MRRRFIDNFNPERLRNLRKARKLTQKDIEKGTGISVFVLSRIERGQRGVDEEELKKIADFFGVDPSYFLAQDFPEILNVEQVTAILEKLTSNDLKFLLKGKNVKNIGGMRKRQLITRLLELYAQELKELHERAKELYEIKLLERVKDGLDHFHNERVELLYVDKDLVKADVNGHSVVIYGLSSGNVEYRCDDSCPDYIYNVKSGRVPFCKHYIATIAELVYNGYTDLDTVPMLNDEHKKLIEKAIEHRKKLEGVSESGRGIETTLEIVQKYYLDIAHQDETIAKTVFKDTAEKVFEELTLKMFDLLEFETISNRNPHGWDGLIIGIHSTPPFIVVLECKTAAGGVYDYLSKHQEYLLTLKMYAVDLVKNRLFGAFRNYVKYVVIVAPGFPSDVEVLKYTFQNMTGLQLSFIPADVLLYFVKRYRETPIVTHTWMEDIFREGGLWTKERIDQLFEKSATMIESLADKLVGRVINWMQQYVSIKSDAAFINFDMPMFEELSREIFQALSPELVIMGKREVTGIETVRIRHDYYAIWEQVLKRVGEAVIDYLRELSETQERTTEMKAEVIRQLRV